MFHYKPDTHPRAFCLSKIWKMWASWANGHSGESGHMNVFKEKMDCLPKSRQCIWANLPKAGGAIGSKHSLGEIQFQIPIWQLAHISVVGWTKHLGPNNPKLWGSLGLDPHLVTGPCFYNGLRQQCTSDFGKVLTWTLTLELGPYLVSSRDVIRLAY